jgi:hypothetical protein
MVVVEAGWRDWRGMRWWSGDGGWEEEDLISLTI